MGSYDVRSDLRECHARTREHLRNAGTWWTSAERLQFAAEVRAARACNYCRERKAAVSPMALDGEHTSASELPDALVDLVHRIVTDPGRLTKSFVHGLFESGAVDEAPYVELVSVVVLTNALDVFDRALGDPPAALPAAVEGEPSRVPPKGAREDGAWVRLVPAGEEGGDVAREIYQGLERVPNIGRALSGVPAELAVLHAFSGPHYMTLDQVSNPKYEEPGRAIGRLQMELVASRVSRMNECFY